MDEKNENERFKFKCDTIESIAKKLGFTGSRGKDNEKDDIGERGYYTFLNPPVTIEVSDDGRWVRARLYIDRKSWEKEDMDMDKLYISLVDLKFRSLAYDRKEGIIHQSVNIPDVPDKYFADMMENILKGMHDDFGFYYYETIKQIRKYVSAPGRKNTETKTPPTETKSVEKKDLDFDLDDFDFDPE